MLSWILWNEVHGLSIQTFMTDIINQQTLL